MSDRRVAAVLLAAGGSTRLGEPKALLAEADGVPRVVRVARDLAAAGCAPVLVVVGARGMGDMGDKRAHTGVGYVL